MIGRKAIVGLSLLCALCFCAFGAASASAAGTTAGECLSAGGKKDFSDAHCDKAVAENTGTFGHKLFEPGAAAVSVTAVNDLTGTSSPFFLEGKIAGIVTKVECKKVSASGTVKNNATTPMTVTFTTATTEFSECVVLTQPCSVVVAKTESAQTTQETLGLGEEKTGPTEEKVKVYQEGKGTEMGLKFAPTGTNFTTLTFSGAECPTAFKTSPVPVKGSVFALGGRGGAATSSGATGVFTKASSLGTLLFAGNPASLEGTLTFRKAAGNPLILTTN